MLSIELILARYIYRTILIAYLYVKSIRKNILEHSNNLIYFTNKNVTLAYKLYVVKNVNRLWASLVLF